MKSTIKLILVVALVAAACVGIVVPAATATPATASQPVLLVCTSAAGLDYALQVWIDSSEAAAPYRAAGAMATTLGDASRQASSPWLGLVLQLQTALSSFNDVTESFRPINAAFAAFARACRARGAPIIILTLHM